MNEVLVIAVVLLWILVLVLVAVVFALTRQVGVLYERVAPAGALMVNQNLKVGDPAPIVSVQTLTGNQRTVGQTEEIPGTKLQLLFFLAPDCPICKSLLPVLKSVQRSEKALDVLLLSDGEEVEPHQQMITSESLEDFDYALSEVAGRSYGVSKLPYAVLIDGEQRVVSLGIVNSREHLESLFEAQRLGVASIQDYLGQTPATDALYVNAAEPPAPRTK